MSSAQSRSWLAKKSNSWISPDWKERERERERDAINEHAHLCSHPHIQIHNLPISHPLIKKSLHKSHCSPTHKMVWTLHHPFVVVYTSSVISPAAASHSTINRALTKHQHTHTAHKAHRVPQSWLIFLIVLATYNPFTQKEGIWYTSTSDLTSYMQFIPGSRYIHYFVEGFLAIVCNVVLWNCH